MKEVALRETLNGYLLVLIVYDPDFMPTEYEYVYSDINDAIAAIKKHMGCKPRASSDKN